ELAADTFSVVRWKLALGVLDYARNAMVATQLASFNADDPWSSCAAHEQLVRLARAHAAFLFDLDPSWRAGCREVGGAVKAVTESLQTLPEPVRSQTLYGYRECDSFIENWMAAEL